MTSFHNVTKIYNHLWFFNYRFECLELNAWDPPRYQAMCPMSTYLPESKSPRANMECGVGDMPGNAAAATF